MADVRLQEPITATLVEPKSADRWWQQTFNRVIAPLLAAGGRVSLEIFDGKSREQERLYHSCFRDIAKYCEAPVVGKTDPETWKRLMVDAFYRATKDDAELAPDWARRAPRIIPNLDGTGFVQVEIQTRRFTKRLATNFITFVHAWGDERGIPWSRTSLGREWPAEAEC